MVRLMTIEDYDQIRALWMTIKGFAIRSIDDSRVGCGAFSTEKSNDKCRGGGGWNYSGSYTLRARWQARLSVSCVCESGVSQARHWKEHGSVLHGCVAAGAD